MLASVSGSITTFVGDHGVYAVFLLMAIDAVFPAASELVMVYAGALAGGAVAGQILLFGHPIGSPFWGFVAVSLAGTLGYLLGSIIGWGIGAYGGRPLIEGRGDAAVFLGRVTPVVRSFISIPAGVFRSPFGRYTLLTLAGSAIWCFAFAGIGWGVGTGYSRVHDEFRWVDYAVVAAVVFGVAWLLYRHFSRRSSRADGPAR